MSTFDEYLAPAPKHLPGKSEDRKPGRDAAGGQAVSPNAASVLRLQRLAGNAAVAQRLRAGDDAEGVERARSGGGQPLDTGTRVQMEQAFGTDFSDVRVHTGSEADASTRSLGAHAYTVGSDVVFSQGRYDPGSEVGQRTLAHELTHVVQQRSGPVDGTETGTGVKVSDPSDRFERAAEASADHVMAGRASDGGATGAAGGAAVQRQEDDEEVQGLFVQRQEEEEEVQEMTAQRQEAAPEEEPEEEPAT
jgi:Domain of unknown function (DUF4157)